MPTTCLIPKPIPSNGIDLALCKRLAEEVCRRASAAESWTTLVFGRSIARSALSIARELAELAEKDADGAPASVAFHLHRPWLAAANLSTAPATLWASANLEARRSQF